jgi:hypothetical protein
MSATKERLHQLVDELPDSEIQAAEQYLASLRANAGVSIHQALARASIDDEPVTTEEEAAIVEAYEDIAAGRIIPNAELWHRLGHDPRP